MPLTDGGGSLDFDKADFGDSGEGLKCATCASEIQGTYYDVNGAHFCDVCHGRLKELFHPERGIRRFVLATVYGIGGGAVGAAVWFAVAKLFNLEIGLIAILVGWLVGRGVQMGHGGRGGLKYQFLAAFLTYGSIVTTYIPPLYESFKQGSQENAPGAATVSTADATPASGVSAAVEDAPAVAATPAAATPVANPSNAPPQSPPGFLSAVLAVAVGAALLYALAFAMPFLMGFSNILGILIIGFAVHQAWTMNRRSVLDIKGPFRVARRLPDDPTAPSPSNVETPVDPSAS